MMNYHSYSGSSAPSHAPDPYRLEIPQVAIDNLLTSSERHKWISEAAYFIAERRGFAPGRELSDRFTAEREVNRVCGLIEPEPRWDSH